jgi:glycosyltransferase involved in cell wall biosynthesis
MNILHVIPSVGPARGGPSFLLRTLTAGLAQSGVRVHVATTDDNGIDRLDVQCGTPIRDMGVTYWFFRRQTRFYTLSLPLNRWLALHVADYDVVHIHALFSFSSVAAAYWARRRCVPYIVRPLGTLNRWGVQKRRPWLKRFSLRFLESRILGRAAVIHYTSEQERIEAAELGIVSRAEIIPNAVDGRPDTCVADDFRARHPELKGRQIVLFLSRFDAKKGLDLLLPAFAKVRQQQPEAMLVLAGNGDSDLTKHLRKECTRLGLGADVLWIGFIEGAEKQAALHDADIFVLPSYSENFGIAPVEAMNAGLPIVISDRVAIHHDVTAAKAGIVVPCDVDRLAEAILFLLQDARLRAEFGRNGRSLVRQRYSLDVITHQLMALYEDIAARRQLVHI